jgi:hypothetical protein
LLGAGFVEAIQAKKVKKSIGLPTLREEIALV